ncbi:hypothetical protein A2U01_0100561, partial [Trifolium medium]|nr:hypothetical protein [Trifolium medium]
HALRLEDATAQAASAGVDATMFAASAGVDATHDSKICLLLL